MECVLISAAEGFTCRVSVYLLACHSESLFPWPTLRMQSKYSMPEIIWLPYRQITYCRDIYT